jgi:hypothetical protein
MSIQSVARWKWLALGALVGLLLWGAQRTDRNDLPMTGESLNDQGAFERRLLTRLGGQPLFKEVVVSRHIVAADPAHPQTVYVVTGKSCDGTVQPDGHYHWSAAFFVARVPYRPTNQATSRRVRVSSTLTSHGVDGPTVVDFLRAAHAAGGVDYTYAWWRTYPFFAWFGGSVLLMGVIWPCVIDLAFYGRLIRPREQRAASLANVPGTTSVAKTPVPQVPRAAIQEQDEQPVVLAQPAPPPAAPTASPVRPLASESPAAIVEDNHDHPDFRAKPEDFYPTQKRAKPGG